MMHKNGYEIVFDEFGHLTDEDWKELFRLLAVPGKFMPVDWIKEKALISQGKDRRD